MLRASSLWLWCLLTLCASGCLPVYDDAVPTPGEQSTCCNERSLLLDSHDAGEGEIASAKIFPGCDCYNGARCKPMYIVVSGGCSPYYPGFIDAGVGPADGGASLDAGTTADAGTAPPDAGPPSEWVACCIENRIVACLCPVVGACSRSQFKACAGGTCSQTGFCSAR